MANPATSGIGRVASRKADLMHCTADELYANLPLGAAELEASLRSRGELRVASMMIGRYESPGGTVALHSLAGPGCESAPHVVRAVTVGAFRLVTGASQSAGGGVGALNVGAQASTSRDEEMLSRDGDFAACTSAASEEGSPQGPPPECGALLRIELARIDQTATRPVVQRDRVCPAGMELVEHEGRQPITEAEGGPESAGSGTSGGSQILA